MYHLELIVASTDFLHQTTAKDAALNFVEERSLVWGWIADHWPLFLEWISQPDVLRVIIVWWVTFTLVMTIMMCLGFGPRGIIPGSIAAAFQSWMYGAFTPAGGIFATLTSVAMLGVAMPAFAALAAVIATAVATASIFVGKK